MTRQPNGTLFVHGAGLQGQKRGSGPFLAHLRHASGGHGQVVAPAMPDPQNPDCQAWMDRIDAAVHKAEGPLVLVGHSLGGAVLLKYLSERRVETPIQAVALFAAPCWGGQDWASAAFALPAGFQAFLPAKPIHLYHSLDDEVVPFAHLRRYRQLLPGAQAHPLRGYGHFFRHGIPDMGHWVAR